MALSRFRVAGRFFRGAAMVFYFQPFELVAEPLGCCQSRFSLGWLPARASPNKTHGCKKSILAASSKSRRAAPSDDKVKKHIVRRRAVFFDFQIARSFCALRSRDGALCGAALVLLKKRACRRFNFPPLLFLSNFSAKLCFRGIFLCQSQSRARLLLLASFCWSPHAVALALLGFRRAPQIRFSFLRRAGDLLRLALGSGIWVGGIEIEALDDLCFEKSTSRSL